MTVESGTGDAGLFGNFTSFREILEFIISDKDGLFGFIEVLVGHTLLCKTTLFHGDYYMP